MTKWLAAEQWYGRITSALQAQTAFKSRQKDCTLIHKKILSLSICKKIQAKWAEDTYKIIKKSCRPQSFEQWSTWNENHPLQQKLTAPWKRMRNVRCWTPNLPNPLQNTFSIKHVSWYNKSHTPQAEGSVNVEISKQRTSNQTVNVPLTATNDPWVQSPL